MSYNYEDIYLEKAKELMFSCTSKVGADESLNHKNKINTLKNLSLPLSSHKFSEKLCNSGRGFDTSFTSPSLTFKDLLKDLDIDTTV